MLAICGGLLFVGVSRHELAAMAPCRRQRRRGELQLQAAVTERTESERDFAEFPPLRLVRG